jgi:hypothetical protein
MKNNTKAIKTIEIARKAVEEELKSLDLGKLA